jgi:hypothetical protein
MLLVKIHLNSVISTPGAKYACFDVKKFYLNMPMDRPEYVRIKIKDVPDEIIKEYNLCEMVDNDGYLYVEVKKGMYGLPQAGLLAQQLLEKQLNKHGYFQSSIIPGFWKHDTRPISFTLVVDNFGVKYVSKEHADHLLTVLKQHYETKDNWTGSKYIGLTIDWDYPHKKVHISMPKYATNALERLGHPTPKKMQNSPYQYTPPNYGAKIQYTEQLDDSPLLDGKGRKYLQAVAGTFLYYGRAVDSTILVAINALAAEQAKPTE